MGYELKQSRDIATAEMYQSRAASIIQLYQFEVRDEAARQTHEKSLRGENLSQWEKVQLHYGNAMYFVHWKNNHFLYQMGLLDQEQWDASLRSMEAAFDIESVRTSWKENRKDYRESFAKAVDQVLARSGR